MKSDKQSRQQQEREREIEKLRKEANPYSIKLISLIITVLAAIALISAQVMGVGSTLLMFSCIGAMLSFFMLWLMSQVRGSEFEERAKQMSVMELRSQFEENRKDYGRAVAFFAIGLLCWGFAVLTGMFDFSGAPLVGGSGALAVCSFYYWKNRMGEKKARQLAKQDSI